MAFALKYFIVFLVLSMVSQGLCRCTFGDIQIGTVRTGREIAGQTEWKVTVTNTCKCPQKHVTLSCGGFAPVKRVEPWLLQPQGNTCLLIKGAALPAGATAHFTYAGQPYIFRPVGSTVDPRLCRCIYGEIQIGTVKTGREIAGQPEWKVTVINTCKCYQKHVTLSSGGFAPVKRVEPWLLLPQVKTCLLIKGEALPAGASAQFTYAGQPYIFRPVASTVDPSCTTRLL